MDAALTILPEPSSEHDHPELGRAPDHPELDHASGHPESGRASGHPESGRAPGHLESDGFTVPRWLEVETDKQSECDTDDQLWDSDNPRFSLANVTGHRITLTSVRDKPSEHIDAVYVVVGFTSEALGDGQFKIGGHAARQAIRIRDAGMLPVDAVLRHKITSAGRDFYKWVF